MRVRSSFLAAKRRDAIEEVAYEICDVRDGPGIDADTAWDTTVDIIELREEKGGGRSGAVVLDAYVTKLNDPHPDRRILKVGNAPLIAKEWNSVKSMFGRSRIIVPVIAVSGFVEDSTRTGLPGQLAAIVYGHIAELSPYSEEPVFSLEDLVRGERADVELATKVIAVLTGELRRKLWGGEQRRPQNLLDLNHELGVDLVLEVNNVLQAGTLAFDRPTSEQRRDIVRNRQDVLKAATRLEAPGTSSMEPGALVELRGLTAKIASAGDLHATLGRVSVQVRCVGESANRIDFTQELESLNGGDLVVVGRVADVRTLSWWRRIRHWVPDVTLEADSIRVEGVRVGQPFGHLHSWLIEDQPLRATGMTHGDLNPRNVLVVGGLVYAIDFDRARDRPPITDPAWLEICLLRDFYSERLGRRLVRLQRLLGFAARVVDSMPDEWDPVVDLASGDEEFERAFRVLWSVRCGARNWYRGGSERSGWWREYLVHLTLAGLRTLKFPDEMQSRPAIHAVLAATGIAAEWMGGSPYRHWLDADLRLTATTLVPRILPNARDTGAVLAEIVAAIDDAGIDAELADVLTQSRDRCVGTWFAANANELLAGYDRSPTEYINLRALLGRPADPPSDLGIHRYRAMMPDPEPAADQPSLRRRPNEELAVAESARRRTLDLLDASNAIHLAGGGVRTNVVVLLGEAGSGKTTIARELHARYARAVLRASRRSVPGSGATAVNGSHGPELASMMPVWLTAVEIDQAIQATGGSGRGTNAQSVATQLLKPLLGRNVAPALRLGGVHITVDGFEDLDPTAHGRVAEWIRTLPTAFSRIRMVICHRVYGFDLEELPFATLVVQEVSDEERREFFVNRFRANNLADPAARADGLIRALTGDGVNDSIKELAQTPRFLWAITDWFAEVGNLPDRPGDLVRGLTERYLRLRLDQLRPPAQFTVDLCVAALETLAGHLLDHESATDETTVLGYLAEHTDRPQELLNLLIGAELINRENAAIRFHRQAFQQYFAAVTLRRQQYDVPAFVGRLLSYRGREELEIMFRFADGSHELAHQLMDPALKADPVLAAQLLRWTGNPYTGDVQRFLYEQEQTLFSPQVGEHAWSAAVNALFELSTDNARHLLHAVARSDDAEPFARSAALAGLLRMRGATPSDRRRAAEDRDITETVRRLLHESTQESLRVQAINAVVDGRLRPLIAYLAALVDERATWPVIRAARRSLASLDQILEARQQATYVAACARRLPQCELERLHVVDNATIEELQDERWELVEVLSHAGRLDLVLPTRFSYAPAEHYYWSDQRRLTTAHRDSAPEAARRAWDVLHGEHTASALIEWFASENDLLAIAAAHRLLAEHPDEARALVDHVSAASSAQKLLAVAATMPHLDDEGLTKVRQIVTELIDAMPFDRLEPLAALLAGLPAQKRTTKRMGLRAMINLRSRFPTTPFGPLERVFTASPRWSDSEISDSLASGAEGRDLAIHGMSMILYTNDARAIEPMITLSPTAVKAFSDFSPSNPTERVVFVRACTSAGLAVLGLGHAFDAVRDPATAALTELSTNRRYGAEIVSRLGEVLTCIGYLGRLAHDEGQIERSEQAHSLLRQFDSTKFDRTVRRGHLLGLAILGDVSPLLTELWTHDRPMHRGARNAIAFWRSGPYTPTWARKDVAIAKFIGERLARNDPWLAPDVRSTLAEIKTLVERRIGRVVRPSS